MFFISTQTVMRPDFLFPIHRPGPAAGCRVRRRGLSFLLGYFWEGIPPDQLLSLSYFTTDTLVALITGLALSQFMGSMN